MSMFDGEFAHDEPEIPDDIVPLSIIREIADLKKYYYSKCMNCVRFEELLDRVGLKAEKMIQERLESAKIRP